MANKTDKNNFYLGNTKLPNKNWTGEYTKSQITSMKKARKNLLYFAQKYFYIIDPDKGKCIIKLFGFQRRALRMMRDNRMCLLLASRQIGKALALDTPIPTPSGWKTMGELRSGDMVYGSDGSPCKVLMAHETRYNRDCYEVIFDNGENIIADAEHNWFTQTIADRKSGSDGEVRTTEEIFQTICRPDTTVPNHRIPVCSNGVDGVELELPIDPYILGYWIGSETNNSGDVKVRHHNTDEIFKLLQESRQFDNITVNRYNDETDEIKISTKKNHTTESLLALLSTHNIKSNKHIPDLYLSASRDQRLELLKGLMDSDCGDVTTEGVARFYSSNNHLAVQVEELIVSLGYKPTSKSFQGQESPTASITFEPIESVAKISFKNDKIKIRDKVHDSELRDQWHYIVNIKKVDSVPVRCITVDSDDSLFLCGRQMIPTHNTTLLTIYALWIAMFNDYQNIVIVANKEATAIEIFRRIRLAYEEMPNYIKAGVREYAKTSCEFENGSRISISTTTGSAARGQTINVMIVDEMAFIEPDSILEDFWRSVFPTISRSKKSKVLVASTPNGTGNLFHKLIDGAERGNNGFVMDRVKWDEIPGRGEEWKQEQIKALGSIESFLQEYENEFLASGDSAIDIELFDELSKACKEPILLLDEGHYKIFEEPSPDRIYTAGVDISEGVGKDACDINILDITDPKNIIQVATYNNNRIPPREFTNRIYEILHHWGCPLALIERNNCGAQVVDRLVNDLGYDKVVSYGAAIAGRNKSQLGVIAHTNTKYKGVLNMRYFVNEVKSVTFHDINTLRELKDFVRYPNGTWKAKGDNHDDRVMSLLYALLIFEKEICERYFEIAELDDYGKPASLLPMDYGITPFENPTSIYNDENIMGESETRISPVVFGADTGYDSELVELELEGYTLL